MRFLFRLIAWILLIGLAFRLLRRMMLRRPREAELAPESHSRRRVHKPGIEDATFTDISES